MELPVEVNQTGGPPYINSVQKRLGTPKSVTLYREYYTRNTKVITLTGQYEVL